MGVDGKFFEQAAPALAPVRLDTLPRLGSHAVVALDASVWIHQFARSADPVGWLGGNMEPAADAFIGRLSRLWKARVSVVVVFDGEPHTAKRNEEARRSARRAKAQATLDELYTRRQAGETIADAQIKKAAGKCVSQAGHAAGDEPQPGRRRRGRSPQGEPRRTRRRQAAAENEILCNYPDCTDPGGALSSCPFCQKRTHHHFCAIRLLGDDCPLSSPCFECASML